MNKFNEREKSFEKKFAKDEELKFKVAARSSKYLGVWVGQKLGKPTQRPRTGSFRCGASEPARSGAPPRTLPPNAPFGG